VLICGSGVCGFGVLQCAVQLGHWRIGDAEHGVHDAAAASGLQGQVSRSSADVVVVGCKLVLRCATHGSESAVCRPARGLLQRNFAMLLRAVAMRRCFQACVSLAFALNPHHSFLAIFCDCSCRPMSLAVAAALT
jgi:hypothetical protein